MYIVHLEIAILSISGALIDLSPNLRKEALKYKNKYKKQTIGELPEKLVTFIFQLLGIEDLKNVSLVCYDWRRLSDVCWKSRIPGNELQQIDENSVRSWKHFYLHSAYSGNKY
jgi:hypothetical protein